MKTFDEEYNELVIWCKQELAEADRKISQLPSIEGRDDRAAPIRNAVWHEWNRKLDQLKAKHNVE